jgi:hypothetical protein
MDDGQLSLPALTPYTDAQLISEIATRFPFLFLVGHKQVANNAADVPMVAKGSWTMLKGLIFDAVVRVQEEHPDFGFDVENDIDGLGDGEDD